MCLQNHFSRVPIVKVGVVTHTHTHARNSIKVHHQRILSQDSHAAENKADQNATRWLVSGFKFSCCCWVE